MPSWPTVSSRPSEVGCSATMRASWAWKRLICPPSNGMSSTSPSGVARKTAEPSRAVASAVVPSTPGTGKSRGGRSPVGSQSRSARPSAVISRPSSVGASGEERRHPPLRWAGSPRPSGPTSARVPGEATPSCCHSDTSHSRARPAASMATTRRASSWTRVWTLLDEARSGRPSVPADSLESEGAASDAVETSASRTKERTAPPRLAGPPPGATGG
jgi:hypothetical protein